jgi:hypothetical protein
MTIDELFDLAERSGSGLAQVIFRDERDEPDRAVVAVLGKPDTAEFLELIGRWYDRMEGDETEAPRE